MQKHFRSLAMLAVVAMLAAGCGSTLPASVAATVGDMEIARSSVEDAVGMILENSGGQDPVGPDRAGTVEPIQRHVLGLMIYAALIESVAVARDIEVDSEAIEDELQEQTEDFESERALDASLAQSNLTLDLYRDYVLPTQSRLDDLREFVRDDVPQVQAREVRHIVVRIETEIERILGRLRDGEDFAVVAAEESLDTSTRSDGGDLGYLPRGSFFEAFDDAVWEAEIDEIVGPVETPLGYHLLQVTGEDTLSLDDIREDAQAPTIDAYLSIVLDDWMAEYPVELASAFGVWDPLNLEVVEPAQVGAD